ncbi:hypothetical protein ACET3Z_031783 [Daucus carota]
MRDNPSKAFIRVLDCRSKDGQGSYLILLFRMKQFDVIVLLHCIIIICLVMQVLWKDICLIYLCSSNHRLNRHYTDNCDIQSTLSSDAIPRSGMKTCSATLQLLHNLVESSMEYISPNLVSSSRKILTTPRRTISCCKEILLKWTYLMQRTPCPESYPLIGNLIGLIKNRHRFHDWVTDMLCTTPSLTLQVTGFLHLSHGICTADPANLHHLLRSNFDNFVKGHRFYSVLHDLLGDGIFNVDGHLWSSQRKIASYEFNTRSLKNFISDTVKLQITNTLIPRLEAACDAGEIIDLQEVLRHFTFDNICSVAFGVDSGDLMAKGSFVEAFDYAVERSSERFMLPVQMIWKMMRFFNVGSERKYREAIKVIDEFAMEVIRLKEKKWELMEGNADFSSEDLLSRFMGSTLDFGFPDQDEKRKFLRDIVISFVLAGKDSTSTALTCLVNSSGERQKYKNSNDHNILTKAINIKVYHLYQTSHSLKKLTRGKLVKK